MLVTVLSAGSKRPPGGLKCTAAAAPIRKLAGRARQRDGVRPYARLKARVNASCEA